MHVSRALLKNTRASIQFHRRLFIFLVALLVVIVALVALASGLPQITTAGDTSSGTGSTSVNNDFFIFNTFADPTTTPTPSSTPTPTPTFPPFYDAPEYGVGGGIIALFAGFVAFTVFLRYGKKTSVNRTA
jgi:hypothetical protein